MVDYLEILRLSGDPKNSQKRLSVRRAGVYESQLGFCFVM